MAFSPQVEQAIAAAAARTGISPDLLRAFVRIESGGDPNNQTGSYRGLMQLSPAEFARNGGSGSIFDPQANVMAGANKIAGESAWFRDKYGRDPTAADLYLVHQQGQGGAAAHWANPDAPAWQNMASTGEGRQRGEAWAKQAIWGNIPDAMKRQFGSVDNVSSRDFTSMWQAKVDGGKPSGPTTQVAALPMGGVTGAPAAASGAPAASAPPSVLASLASGNMQGAASGLSGVGSAFGGGSGGMAGSMADERASASLMASMLQDADPVAPRPQPVDMGQLLAILKNRQQLGMA